jgi:hypothetical protein
VVDAKKQLPLREIHQQRDEVAGAALNLQVVALAEIVDAQMSFGSAGHSHGDFFAQEEVRQRPQCLGTFNRVVVRDGDGRHASPFQKVVNFKRLVVALLAQVLEAGKVEHSGSFRVNMEVAAHERIVCR